MQTKIMCLCVRLLFTHCVGGFLMTDSMVGGDDYFNQKMVHLLHDVAERYLSERPSCVVVVAEPGLLEDFDGYDHTTVIRVDFRGNTTTCDPNLHEHMVFAFHERCSSYVVQISNPSCFFPAWFLARNKAIYEKHYPRVVFLPVKPYSQFYGENVLSMNESNISQDILIAEVSQDDTGDWPVTLFTNNFWQHAGEPRRQGRVLIDQWGWKSGFKYGVNLFPDKVKNLQGKVLRLASFTYKPYAILEDFDGTEVRILLGFCALYNCTLVVKDFGNLWGEVFPENGTAIGAAGAIYSEKADFGVAANYLWTEYWPHVEFSSCYLYGATTVMTPKPEVLGGLLTPFLPFPPSLWFAVLLAVAVSSAGLHFLTRTTFKLVPSMRENIRKNPKFITYTDSVLRSIGMLVLQQPSTLVTGSPVRHLFTAFEVIYLVVTSAYAAELYDYLTIPRSAKPIDTVEDLAASNLIWMADHEVWVFGVAHSTDPSLQKMAANFRAYPEAELIERSENGRYGMAIERLAGGHYAEVPYITEKFIEKSRVMKDDYFRSPLVAFLQKGSPYAERLNKFIGRTLNGGLFYAWEGDVIRKYLNYKKQMDLIWSSRPVKYPPKVLQLGDLEGAFLLYAVGATLSVVIFLVELAIRVQSKSIRTILDPTPKWFEDHLKLKTNSPEDVRLHLNG